MANNLLALDGSAYFRVGRVIDYNNTSYYVDPASTSVVQDLDIQGDLYCSAFSYVNVADGLRASSFGVGGYNSSYAYHASGKTSGLNVANATGLAVVAVGNAGGAYFEDDNTGTYAFIAHNSYGILSNGTKSFVEPHPTDSDKAIVYASLEGGEAGTYYRGSARLDHGTAVIKLPEHFSLVTEEEGLTAQVTPREDCNGLYVAEVTTTTIVVKELQGGTSNARFDFFINGVRAGYADYEVIREASEVVLERASAPDGGRPHE